MDEFIWMTADAQRDIHDDDRVRSSSMLWRMVYERLRLLEDARQMRRKVLGLRSLFGLGEQFGKEDDGSVVESEGLQVAAQLIFDVVTNRNIYHKVNEVGRSSYLRLHRLRFRLPHIGPCMHALGQVSLSQLGQRVDGRWTITAMNAVRISPPNRAYK